MLRCADSNLKVGAGLLAIMGSYVTGQGKISLLFIYLFFKIEIRSYYTALSGWELNT